MAMNYFSENIDLYTTIFAELKNIGVKVPKVKNFKSCVQKPDKKAQSLDCRMFGISLYKQEWTYDCDYPLPKFLAMSTTYLLNFTKTLGLFRKSGSLVRQRSLRSNLEKGESIEGSDPNDVASLLKQWLRELPEPLIPLYMQDLFVRCQHLVNKQDCTSASLLCCLLLPPDHLHPFKHLMCFLKTFAAHCSENKMGAHNLALMMAPNIFISKAESISKPGSIVIQLHTSVIELLIENSEHIGEVPRSVSLKYSIPLGSKAAASSGIVLDYSPSKLTKKFKNDFVSGIKKLVGQNSTSCSSTSDKHWNSPKIGCRSVLSNNTEEMFSTPLRVKDKQTTKPRTLSNHTRRKSFGLLRKKDRSRKNSSKRNSFTKRNQAIPKGNSSSRNVSKRNSTSKVQNSGSGSAGSEECSDSSSPQDDYFQTQCELFPNNEDEIYMSTCLNDPVLQEADNKYLLEPQISNNIDTKKLEQCEKSHISPQKFNGLNCHRKLFTSCGSSADPFVDFQSLNKPFDNNSESIEYQISGEMNLKPGSSYKSSVKIRKSDIEKLGKLKGHCDNDEPTKSKTTSQSKINSKTSFDVGNLDLKSKQEELNMRVKDIDSNYENETNDRSFSNSLNRSKSFIGDPRWKTKYNASTKTPKKTVRSSSLIRGKPNTVKSGLPYQRFYRDLILTPKAVEIKNKMGNVADNKQFTPIKLNEPLTTSEKKSEGYSFEQKISLVSISGKDHSPFSNDSNDNESVRLLSFISPTAGKDSLNTLSLKNRGRLSLPLSQKDTSCSSSSKIPRFNYSVNKGALNSFDKKSQLSERSGNSKIPLFKTSSTSDADTSLNDSLFYTPKQTMSTGYNSTIWLSSNQFLESDTPQTESFNKRESIAMILKNHTGHVRSKVQLYNSREVKSCPTPGSSPPTYQSTPCRRSYSQRQPPSSKNHKPLSILQRCESSSNKRVHGKAKVKIPLKPLLSESKASDLELVVNHPLKEVTNINLNGKQNFNYESTPTAEKGWNVKHEEAHRVCSDSILNKSILKRNSFAGRTPAKLSKRVCRSESSPNCPRPGSRLFKTPGQSTVVNQGMKVERHSSFSPVISLSSVKKSDSSLSNQKLKHGDIIDEWLCEF